VSTPNPLDTIFSGVIGLTSAADRVAYIARAFGDDRALRLKVERLIGDSTASLFATVSSTRRRPPGRAPG
jgi:hypothetical protein